VSEDILHGLLLIVTGLAVLLTGMWCVVEPDFNSIAAFLPSLATFIGALLVTTRTGATSTALREAIGWYRSKRPLAKASAIAVEALLAFFFWFFAFATPLMPVLAILNPDSTLREGVGAAVLSGSFALAAGAPYLVVRRWRRSLFASQAESKARTGNGKPSRD